MFFLVEKISTIDISKIYQIFDKKEVLLNKEILFKNYVEPFLHHPPIIYPLLAVYPKSADQISKLFKYINDIGDVNIVIISSTTNPKLLDDTICTENSIILDLRYMKQIPFIDKRNRVCVLEPGVNWEELTKELEKYGMRPLSPLLPRRGKSVLASIIDREPHLIPKRQFDISDPLLCMEVVFGNGEIFRTGEAAGPHSIEKNREYGAALTNPLGPAQTDIFRIIQGSKGTYGCVSWISMQCDLIPTKRIIKFIDSDKLDPLNEFIYESVRKRLVDEVFIINKNLFGSIFDCNKNDIREYILIFAVNGYEILPDEKISYQLADLKEIIAKFNLKAQEAISTISQTYIDGKIIEPHPKFKNNMIAIDLFYNTTLDRVEKHIQEAYKIINEYKFPSDRFYIYIQPVIQARAVNVEFSFLADITKSDNIQFNQENVEIMIKKLASFVSQNGGFFSRSYKLINDFAFTDKNISVQISLKKLKEIFDSNHILNRGQLIF